MSVAKKSRQQIDAERRQNLSKYPKHPGDPKNVHRPKYILGETATDVKEHIEDERGNRRRFRKEVYAKLLEQAVDESDLKKEDVLGETFYYNMACFHCGGHNLIKSGTRKPKKLKNSVTQLYKCKDCGRITSRRQTSEEIEKLEKIRILYNEGCSVKEICRLLKEVDGYEVSESYIYRYIKRAAERGIIQKRKPGGDRRV